MGRAASRKQMADVGAVERRHVRNKRVKSKALPGILGQRWLPWAGGGAGVAAVVAVVLVFAHGAPTDLPGPSLNESSTSAPAPEPDAATALHSIKRVSTSALVDGGRPVIFFMGGQFCPFCAADRWSFVKATARFGTWSGLHVLHSQAGTDGFASLPTYDLTQATYQSDVISVQVREVADRNGNPLQSLSGAQRALVDRYDPGGSIPFTIVGGASGQYKVDLAYSPGLIQGQDFDALRAAVDSDSSTPAASAIRGSADALTALLCKLTNGQAAQPAAVCSSAFIQGLESQLP